MLRRLKAKTKRQPSPANSPVQLVVGLRNPGADYEGTRHNLGYEIVARLVSDSGEEFG